VNLVLDIGNSSIKYGVFDGDHPVKVGVLNEIAINQLQSDISGKKIKRVMISAVAPLPPDLEKLILGIGEVFYLDEKMQVPVKNGYETPHTLGRDRLANACAAHVLFPGQDVLIIDAGTCLKFDFVSHDGIYSGGSISPGLKMRFKALNTFTARLPLLDPVSAPALTGKNTTASIQSGVVNGMVAEIEGFILQYRELYPRLELILTGGDSEFFLNQLKSRIFVAPVFTLQGLNAILQLQHHDENK
jgi:type III pantothenate kinase